MRLNRVGLLYENLYNFLKGTDYMYCMKDFLVTSIHIRSIIFKFGSHDSYW